MLYNCPPSLDYLKVFVCLCYATVVHSTHKFDPCATCCIFVGYPNGKKGYKLYDLEIKKFFVSCNVKFYQIIFPFSSISTSPTPNFVLPHFSPDIPQCWPSPAPFSTHIPSPQPQQQESLNTDEPSLTTPTHIAPDIFVPPETPSHILHIPLKLNSLHLFHALSNPPLLLFSHYDTHFIPRNLRHGIKTTQYLLTSITLPRHQVLHQVLVLFLIFFPALVSFLPIVLF